MHIYCCQKISSANFYANENDVRSASSSFSTCVVEDGDILHTEVGDPTNILAANDDSYLDASILMCPLDIKI